MGTKLKIFYEVPFFFYHWMTSLFFIVKSLKPAFKTGFLVQNNDFEFVWACCEFIVEKYVEIKGFLHFCTCFLFLIHCVNCAVSIIKTDQRSAFHPTKDKNQNQSWNLNHECMDKVMQIKYIFVYKLWSKYI